MQALVQKNYILRNANDDLRKELYCNQNRMRRTAVRMGFDDFENLEERIFAERHLWNGHATDRNSRNCNNICDYEDTSMSQHNQISDQKDQYHLMESKEIRENRMRDAFWNDKMPYKRELLRTTNNNRSIPSSLLPSIKANNMPIESSDCHGNCVREREKLLADFRQLNQKYDTLLAAQERTMARYKQDYRKWKIFKSWLYDEVSDTRSHNGLELNSLRTNLRSLFLDVANSKPPNKEDDLAETCTKQYISVDRAQMQGFPCRSSDTNSAEGSFYQEVNMNDVKDSKIAINLQPTNPGNSRIVSRSQYGVNNEVIISNTAPKQKLSIEECNSISRSSGFSQNSIHDRAKHHKAPIILSEQINPVLRTPPVKCISHAPICEASHDGTPILSEKDENNYMVFEIDPTKNEGLTHCFDDTVRNKTKRRRLDASDCVYCQDYYKALNESLPKMEGPLWMSPSGIERHSNTRGMKIKGGLTAPSHKQEISRHRHQWTPPSTPPNYWTIAFPTTQEVEDINNRANDLRDRKEEKLMKELSIVGGRYRKKARTSPLLSKNDNIR